MRHDLPKAVKCSVAEIGVILAYVIKGISSGQFSNPESERYYHRGFPPAASLVFLYPLRLAIGYLDI